MKLFGYDFFKKFGAAALVFALAAGAAIYWIHTPQAGDPPSEASETHSQQTSMIPKAQPKKEPANVTGQPMGIVCLTFDDGPSPHTRQILDTLKKYGVKATFFIVGRSAQFHPELVLMEKEQGHRLAVHTYSHEYPKVYASVKSYLDDFHKTQDAIYAAAGEKPVIFRFPGGSVNSWNKSIRVPLIAETERLGYRYFDWNVSGADSAPRVTSYDIFANIASGVKRGRTNVVLMHDTSKKSADALESVIKNLQKRGYVFKTIGDDTPQVTFHKKQKPAAAKRPGVKAEMLSPSPKNAGK